MKRRIKQGFANIEQGMREPRSVGRMVRQGVRKSLVRLWRTRGGGLYGLGYVVTFVLNEVPRIIDSAKAMIDGSESVLGAIFEWLLRLGADTFESMLIAFLWPAYILGLTGGWGLVALVVAYFVFEKLLRPLVESALPDLKPSVSTDSRTS